MGYPTSENVYRQIPALLVAERTLGNDPRIRQSLDRCGDILPTAFANDNKGMNAGCWAMEHAYSIGEYKANISTIPPVPSLTVSRLHDYSLFIRFSSVK